MRMEREGAGVMATETTTKFFSALSFAIASFAGAGAAKGTWFVWPLLLIGVPSLVYALVLGAPSAYQWCAAKLGHADAGKTRQTAKALFQAADKKWDFNANNGEPYKAFVEAFRQAAHEGRFAVWGRRDDDTAAASPLLVEIPKEEWPDMQLRFGFLAEDINDVFTVGGNPLSKIYDDLHVETKQAKGWLDEFTRARNRKR